MQTLTLTRRVRTSPPLCVRLCVMSTRQPVKIVKQSVGRLLGEAVLGSVAAVCPFLSSAGVAAKLVLGATRCGCYFCARVLYRRCCLHARLAVGSD